MAKFWRPFLLMSCLQWSCSAWLDYYEIMKIPQNASIKETKKAFRMRALELHPDKNSSPNAEALFRDLVEAYETLSEPSARSVYDSSYLSKREFARNNPPAPPPPKSSKQTGTSSSQKWPDYHEFFKNFDENMRRHFEDHAKSMNLGPGMDAHMQAHAKAHAEHMRIHASIAGIGTQHSDPRGSGNSNKWQHLIGDIISDDAGGDEDLQAHLVFLTNKEKTDTTEGRRVHQRSRTCSKVSETTNGVTTMREHCSES